MICVVILDDKSQLNYTRWFLSPHENVKFWSGGASRAPTYIFQNRDRRVNPTIVCPIIWDVGVLICDVTYHLGVACTTNFPKYTTPWKECPLTFSTKMMTSSTRTPISMLMRRSSWVKIRLKCPKKLCGLTFVACSLNQKLGKPMKRQVSRWSWGFC